MAVAPRAAEDYTETDALLSGSEDPKKGDDDKEELLPWSFEQRVAMCLNPVKIPLIVLVGFFGCIVEEKIGASTIKTWKAPVWRKGPMCYIHKIDVDKYKTSNNSFVNAISESVNRTMTPIKGTLAAQMSRDKNSTCYDVDGVLRCDFFDSRRIGLGVHIKKDHCGLTDKCKLDPEIVDAERGGGLGWRLPYMYHCLVWAIYKLLFLPVHPVDRCAFFVAGSTTEPIFKLLTEPHFQCANKVMHPLVLIFKTIRYTFLPNSLLVPLLTMDNTPKCDGYIWHDIDHIACRVVYVWLIFDAAFTVFLYALGKSACGGQCVGTWKYRIYKLYWFSSNQIAIILFFVDGFAVFNWRFWSGLKLSLRAIFTIDLNFSFMSDFVQLLGTVNLVLDTASFSILLLSYVAPALLQRFTGLGNKDKAVGMQGSPPAAQRAAE